MVTWMHFLEKESIFACQYGGESQYIVMGVPMDWTTTYMPGTRFAPQRIREASCNIELYSALAGRSIEHISYNDLGNLVLPFGNTQASIERIERAAKGLREDYSGGRFFIIGGEHLVTLPIVRAFKDEIDSIIVFDAHGDLRGDYLGEELSHATVIRRIAEETGKDITIIGVRALSSEELEYAGKNNLVNIVSSLEAMRPDDIVGRLGVKGNVYISIDMDSIDPAYAPGVSNPEALGLTPVVLLRILGEILVKAKRVIGIDVVEVNPLRDVNDVTSILAAKIIVEATGILDGLN